MSKEPVSSAVKSKPMNAARPESYPLAVVGTVAIDALESPFGRRDKVFGGSASYFSYAASFFTPVALAAVVGRDFPDEYRNVLRERPIDLTNLEVADGKTFFWRGRYGSDLNSAQTLETQLNVLANFKPKLQFSTRPDFLFLANVDPEIQLSVLNQLEKPRMKFTACDTMNYWIANKKDKLKEVLARVDCLVMNDGEARELTGEINLVKAAQKVREWGPQHVVIKKGEHGVLLFFDKNFFALPAYPLESVFDPTGAGDSFAGGMMGYLTSRANVTFEEMKRAVAFGSMIASFTVEEFGLERLRKLKLPEVQERLEIFRKFCTLT